jgi:hypothetical protein
MTLDRDLRHPERAQKEVSSLPPLSPEPSRLLNRSDQVLSGLVSQNVTIRWFYKVNTLTEPSTYCLLRCVAGRVGERHLHFAAEPQLRGQVETLNPQPQTLNPEPSTLNPSPLTPDPKPQTLDLKSPQP